MTLNNADAGRVIALSGRHIAAADHEDVPLPPEPTDDDRPATAEPDAPESAPSEPAFPLPRLWRAADLRPAAQARWLAKNRIPLAAISLLVGDEGIGKSLLWVILVAAVTNGKPLPGFGIPARAPQPVLLVCTEDEWSTTVRPRLEVAGADLTRVTVICTEDDGSGAPVFPRDLYLIREASPAPALIVVDAWLDTVAPGLNVKDPQQARQALHPWKEVATTTEAAVMLLTHTNRVPSTNARDRYGITGELRKKARMTLFAQADEAGRLVVGPEKMNTAAPIPASVFAITPVQVFQPTEDYDGTVPLLTFTGESDRTAREHLAASTDPESDEPGGNPAQAFVADYLMRQGGEAAAGEVIKAGRVAGFSENDLKNARARSKPRIVSRKASFGDGWVWAIAVDGDATDEGVTETAQGIQGVTQYDTAHTSTPSTPSTPSAPTSLLYSGAGCLLCDKPDAADDGICARCSGTFTTAGKRPTEVGAAIGKILAGVAIKPRFNSAPDRIRDTISDKTIREHVAVAVDHCRDRGWLRTESVNGRKGGFTITDRGRRHLRRFEARAVKAVRPDDQEIPG